MKLAQFGSRDFLKAIRPFVGLFVVLLLFAMDAELRSLFFKGGNFKTILTQTVIVAIGAMGMTLVIVSGGIDLSAGSLVALCSVVTAKLIEHGHGLAAVVAVRLQRRCQSLVWASATSRASAICLARWRREASRACSASTCGRSPSSLWVARRVRLACQKI